MSLKTGGLYAKALMKKLSWEFLVVRVNNTLI